MQNFCIVKKYIVQISLTLPVAFIIYTIYYLWKICKEFNVRRTQKIMSAKQLSEELNRLRCDRLRSGGTPPEEDAASNKDEKKSQNSAFELSLYKSKRKSLTTFPEEEENLDKSQKKSGGTPPEEDAASNKDEEKSQNSAFELSLYKSKRKSLTTFPEEEENVDTSQNKSSQNHTDSKSSKPESTVKNVASTLSRVSRSIPLPSNKSKIKSGIFPSTSTMGSRTHNLSKNSSNERASKSTFCGRATPIPSKINYLKEKISKNPSKSSAKTKIFNGIQSNTDENHIHIEDSNEFVSLNNVKVTNFLGDSLNLSEIVDSERTIIPIPSKSIRMSSTHSRLSAFRKKGGEDQTNEEEGDKGVSQNASRASSNKSKNIRTPTPSNQIRMSSSSRSRADEYQINKEKSSLQNASRKDMRPSSIEKVKSSMKPKIYEHQINAREDAEGVEQSASKTPSIQTGLSSAGSRTQNNETNKKAGSHNTLKVSNLQKDNPTPSEIYRLDYTTTNSSRNQPTPSTHTVRSRAGENPINKKEGDENIPQSYNVPCQAATQQSNQPKVNVSEVKTDGDPSKNKKNPSRLLAISSNRSRAGGPGDEEAPKEEAPKEEAPKEEAPQEEAPQEEAPKEEAPKENPENPESAKSSEEDKTENKEEPRESEAPSTSKRKSSCAGNKSQVVIDKLHTLVIVDENAKFVECFQFRESDYQKALKELSFEEKFKQEQTKKEKD